MCHPHSTKDTFSFPLLTKKKKAHRTPLHPITTISKPTIIPTSVAKMGKKSHSKADPSKSTSLVLAWPAPSKGANNRVLIREKDAEEEFLEKLILGGTDCFEAGLNEPDGGYSGDRDGGGGG